MTGIITRSMPVFVVENRGGGNRAHAHHQRRPRPRPALRRQRRQRRGPTALARHRGRAAAGRRRSARPAVSISARSWPRRSAWATRCTSGIWRPRRCFTRALMPHLARVGGRHHALARLAEVHRRQRSVLPQPRDGRGQGDGRSGRRRAGSTLVTTMARNGTDFGIRVSALGERWFTAPVETPVGLYFPGFGRPTPIPTWATARSSRRSASAAWRWPPRRRWRASWASAAWPTRSATTEAMREISHRRAPGLPDPHARRPRHAGRRGRASGRRDRRDAADQHRHRRAAGGHRPGRRGRGARAARLLHGGAGGAERRLGLLDSARSRRRSSGERARAGRHH